MKSLKHITLILLTTTIIFASCSKDDDSLQPNNNPGETTISFDATVGDQDFELNKDFTVAGKKVSFTRFRYWVSNVVLVKADGSEYEVPDSYYLIEENTALPVQDGSHNKIYPANKREDVILKDIPAGDYTAIRFGIGVDEQYNDNLALSAGELNALNGMASDSWMWFTSYIFTTVAGRIYENESDTEGKFLQLETGSNDNYKEVSIDLGQNLAISSNNNSRIHLNVDLSQLVNGIDIWTNSTIGAATPEVMASLADNFAGNAIAVKAVENTNK